jgi:hypothetical protein
MALGDVLCRAAAGRERIAIEQHAVRAARERRLLVPVRCLRCVAIDAGAVGVEAGEEHHRGRAAAVGDLAQLLKIARAVVADPPDRKRALRSGRAALDRLDELRGLRDRLVVEREHEIAEAQPGLGRGRARCRIDDEHAAVTAEPEGRCRRPVAHAVEADADVGGCGIARRGQEADWKLDRFTVEAQRASRHRTTPGGRKRNVGAGWRRHARPAIARPARRRQQADDVPVIGAREHDAAVCRPRESSQRACAAHARDQRTGCGEVRGKHEKSAERCRQQVRRGSRHERAPQGSWRQY